MGENKKKLADFISAVKDEATDVLLSDALPEVVKNCGEVLFSEGTALIASSVLGAVCPRINNIRLSYKQNRLERNVAQMLQMLAARDQSFNDRITALESSIEGRRFIAQSGELMLDGIVDEVEEEKVKYNVNGFLNLIQADNPNMDMALMFFKTLYELNDLDIRILTSYDVLSILHEHPAAEEGEQLDYQQLRYVKEKLVRLGLLSSKNDELSAKNLEMIIDYLQKTDKDLHSKKPKGVKVPRFKKLYNSDSYRITSLGRTLLQLISDNCNLDDISVPNEEEDDTEIENLLS